jgi:restriction endonuclease Mrr
MAAKKKSAAKKRAPKQDPEPQELLLNELREIYSAENQLMKAMPRLTKAMESETLHELMNRRLEQAEELVAEIENVFEEMEETPTAYPGNPEGPGARRRADRRGAKA